MLLCDKNVRAFNVVHYYQTMATINWDIRIFLCIYEFLCHLMIVFLFPKYIKCATLVGCDHNLHLDYDVIIFFCIEGLYNNMWMIKVFQSKNNDNPYDQWIVFAIIKWMEIELLL
jgi:hypothetical protein